MGEQTGISWADSTANLWVGCQKVSEACDHCYAEDLMATTGSRFKRVEWGPDGERQLIKQGWADIRKWERRAAAHGGLDPELGRRRRIFVNSLSDFFDNHRSVVWRDEAWALIRHSPSLIFMLVTKRPQLIGRMLPEFWPEIAERVWLITTTETHEWAERRVHDLVFTFSDLARPAVLGVSCEPLLGPINLAAIPGETEVDWVIVGGESGDEARPTDPAWVHQLLRHCKDNGIAFHFKQWGEWGPALGTRKGDVIFQHEHPDFPGNDALKLGSTMRRIGKLTAGRSLRGREYLEFPCAA